MAFIRTVSVKDERVEAYIFTCILSYIIEKVAEKMLKDRNIKITGERIFSLFKQMGVAVMRADKESCAYTSELICTQRKILKTLKIPLPLRIIKR